MSIDGQLYSADLLNLSELLPPKPRFWRHGLDLYCNRKS